MRHFINARKLLFLGMFAGGLSAAASVQAEDAWSTAYAENTAGLVRLADLDIDDGYVFGVGRFDLDAHTEIIGWRLTEAWYLGRQDGEDSGLTLVWQNKANQLSLSKDGLRLTRRF